MRRVLRCLSPSGYPLSAYVLFCLALLLAACGAVPSRWLGQAYLRPWLLGAPVWVWRSFLVYVLVAAAAIINGFSPKFYAAQGVWAGRTHWVVPAVLGIALAYGAWRVKRLGYEDVSDWVLVVFLCVQVSTTLHGLVLHVFTCPDDLEGTPSQPPLASLLRVLAWCSYLVFLVSPLLWFVPAAAHLPLSDLATIAFGCLAVTHMVGAAALHFPDGPWSVWSFSAGVPEGPAPDSPDRRLSRFDFRVKVRGVALMGFWLGAFLLWLAFYIHAGDPGHPASIILAIYGLIWAAVGGVLTLLMPHPASRPNRRAVG